MNRGWYVIAILALFALVWMGRYQIIPGPSDHIVYKLDRVTGDIEVIAANQSLGPVRPPRPPSAE